MVAMQCQLLFIYENILKFRDRVFCKFKLNIKYGLAETGDHEGPPIRIPAALAPTILWCVLCSYIVGEPCLGDRYSGVWMGWEGPRGRPSVFLSTSLAP